MSYWGEYHMRQRTGLCVQASCPNKKGVGNVRCPACAKRHADAERERMRRKNKIKPANYRK